MTTVHQAEVGKLANELTAADPDYEAMHKDPDVVDAAQALESARRALNLDRHNPDRQQAARDAEKDYLAATNRFFHNARMTALEAEKETKRVKVEAQEALEAARRKEAQEMTPEKRALLKKYATVL